MSEGPCWVRSTLVALALSLGLTAVACAQVRESLSYRHYPVEVEADESLTRAMTRATPIRPGWWRRFHGLARWNVVWSYRQEQVPDGGCTAVDVEVELVTEITLPQWVSGSDKDRGVFEAYLAALKNHELGHHEIARDAANKVLAGIRQSGPHADCGALDARIQALTGALIETAKAVEKQYDEDTRYGRTQGVMLEQ